MNLKKWQIMINLGLIISLFVPLKTMAQTSLPEDINLPNHNIEQELSIPSNTQPSLREENLNQSTENLLEFTPDYQSSECIFEDSNNQNNLNPDAFLVKTIEVKDNTVLSEEIKQLTNSFINRNTTLQELFCLRSEITQLYLTHGYLTSGAFLPQQEFTDGKIIIQIVEGNLQDIEVTGLNHLAPEYISDRLFTNISIPLNQQQLQDSLQLLKDNPLINSFSANLIAGTRSGSNILTIKVTENPPFHTGIYTANNQSPSIGEMKTSLVINHDNLLGIGDNFSATYGLTEGLDTYDLNYTIPINNYDGTMSIGYSNSDSNIIEKEFQDLGIRSESNTLSFNFEQPIFRTFSRFPENNAVSAYNEIKLGLGLDLRQSQTFLLDNIPFSFSIGAENGQSKVTVLNFSQQWLQRNNNSIFAVRSQFNFGLDILDATVNNTGTDGRFFSWLGQFQYVQQLSPSTVLLTSLNAQLTPDSLLSLQQFSIGGVDTVRGYRQNQLVADNGITGSISARINLTSDQNLQLTPFFEFGTAWNSDNTNSNFETIASLGVGFRWRMFNDFILNINYGIPLIPVKNQSNSLQEDGLHFSFGYQPW